MDLNSRPSKRLRKAVLSNSLAKSVLNSVEHKLGTKIKFYIHNDTSEWDPDNYTISIDRRKKHRIEDWLNGGTWPNRLLFHELGHAFLETFQDKLDYKTFKKLFGGLSRYNVSLKSILKGNLNGRAGVTRYARSNAHEAFAEAFSFVIANVDDGDEDPKTIEQLAYVDWMIENIKTKKRRWGKFKGYSVNIQCAECDNDFILNGCRKSLDIRNWEIICPHCQEEILGS